MAGPITKPLLILAFNRPEHVRRLIDSLRPYRPQKILVGVDGPREKSKSDKEKIAQVLNEVNKIDWTKDVELRVREKNLGLRFAVADAVTWVIEKYGEVIVVEDDIEVGPEFLQFMSEMLDLFRNDNLIGHISGYNLVPKEILAAPENKVRISMIPESYAWATWGRAWRHYDPSLEWAMKQSLSSLNKHLDSLLAGLVWKINFHDSASDLINTWAYRWVSALWSEQLRCVSPNRNLVKYTGRSGGTHTRFQSSLKELPVESIKSLSQKVKVDFYADKWIQRAVFRATLFGSARRILESVALFLIALARRSNR